MRVPGMRSSDGNSGGPALTVHGLSKHFGDRVAFQDVSFEIGHGEVFGFLGPNGADKTTMVRTLGTLLCPTNLECFADLYEAPAQPIASAARCGAAKYSLPAGQNSPS